MNATARYTALETEAVRVRSFEVAWVHGLLQAPEYTRVLVVVCVVLTAARSDEKHRRDSAHGTLQTVLNFVLRLVGREAMPSSPPAGPTAAGRPATPVRQRPVRRRRLG